MSAVLDIFSRKKVREEKKKIVVDMRERNSLVPSFLTKEGFEIEWSQLAVGDYLIGDVAVERKTISDLKSSIVSKRIVQQLIELKQYKNSVLLIEGFNDESYVGGIHENALRGFLWSVALDYSVNVIYSLDEADTARYFSVLAKRTKKSKSGMRVSKIAKTEEEQKKFILEGFPGVGAVAAEKLIEKFGNLRKIANASLEELEEILGKKAEKFKKLWD